MESVEPWKFETLDSCVLCGSGTFETVLDREVRSVPLRFVKCAACGLVFQNPRLTRKALAQYFSSSTFIKDSDAGEHALKEQLGYYDYLSWDESYRRTARIRLNRIAGYKRPPGHLLEIGTATGSFLNEARQAGFSVQGLDVSSTFAAMARARYGLNIDLDFIEDAQLPPVHYDVVCNFGGIACWNDPLKALRNIRCALKPDGVLVVNHANVDGLIARLLGKRYPEYNHASLTVFSNVTMRRCFALAGFEVVFSENERQHASLGRIVTYFRSPVGVAWVRALRLERRMIPVIALGTTFCICVPQGEDRG